MMYGPGMSDEARESRKNRSLLKTEGNGWDVGAAVRFLAGDEARWMTGVILPVDAGATVRSHDSIILLLFASNHLSGRHRFRRPKRKPKPVDLHLIFTLHQHPHAQRFQLRVTDLEIPLKLDITLVRLIKLHIILRQSRQSQAQSSICQIHPNTPSMALAHCVHGSFPAVDVLTLPIQRSGSNFQGSGKMSSFVWLMKVMVLI
jgi:hypothetical protein